MLLLLRLRLRLRPCGARHPVGHGGRGVGGLGWARNAWGRALASATAAARPGEDGLPVMRREFLQHERQLQKESSGTVRLQDVEGLQDLQFRHIGKRHAWTMWVHERMYAVLSVQALAGIKVAERLYAERVAGDALVRERVGQAATEVVAELDSDKADTEDGDERMSAVVLQDGEERPLPGLQAYAALPFSVTEVTDLMDDLQMHEVQEYIVQHLGIKAMREGVFDKPDIERLHSTLGGLGRIGEFDDGLPDGDSDRAMQQMHSLLRMEQHRELNNRHLREEGDRGEDDSGLDDHEFDFLETGWRPVSYGAAIRGESPQLQRVGVVRGYEAEIDAGVLALSYDRALLSTAQRIQDYPVGVAYHGRVHAVEALCSRQDETTLVYLEVGEPNKDDCLEVAEDHVLQAIGVPGAGVRWSHTYAYELGSSAAADNGADSDFEGDEELHDHDDDADNGADDDDDGVSPVSINRAK